MLQKLKDFFEKYDRRMGFIFLIGGFIFDSLTLRRVDILTDNLVLLLYIFIVAVGIIFVNSRISSFSLIAPYLMQFAFGGLFSGFIIFYSRSSTIFASWPFLLMLLIFFIGNEFFRKKYEQITYHLAIFFIAIFSYFIFTLPLIFNRVDTLIFILSGIFSILAISGVLYFLNYIIEEEIRKNKNWILGIIGFIYLAFNLFYFLNIIPPLPLSLKEAGIYHSVLRSSDGNYLVLDEKRKWYDGLLGNKFYFTTGSSVYGYSSVFSPANIDIKIYHRWSIFNKKSDSWIPVSKIGFGVSGGRDGGYRGYSFKENLVPGKWRLDVITESGQIIGRTEFRAILADREVELVRKTL